MNMSVKDRPLDGINSAVTNDAKSSVVTTAAITLPKAVRLVKISFGLDAEDPPDWIDVNKY